MFDDQQRNKKTLPENEFKRRFYLHNRDGKEYEFQPLHEHDTCWACGDTATCGECLVSVVEGLREQIKEYEFLLFDLGIDSLSISKKIKEAQEHNHPK